MHFLVFKQERYICEACQSGLFISIAKLKSCCWWWGIWIEATIRKSCWKTCSPIWTQQKT